MTFIKLIADKLNGGREYGAPSKLAKKIKYSSVVAQEWARGTRAPGPEAIPLIAKALGITDDEVKACFPHRYGSTAAQEPHKEYPPPPEIVESIPVIGVVSGSIFKEPFEDAFALDTLPIPYRPKPGQRRYALRISGDCMAPKARDGDFAIIVTTPYVPEGETGVICMGDECTLKKIHYDGEYLELKPHNPDYKAIRVKASMARIVGLCLGYFSKP